MTVEKRKKRMVTIPFQALQLPVCHRHLRHPVNQMQVYSHDQVLSSIHKKRTKKEKSPTQLKIHKWSWNLPVLLDNPGIFVYGILTTLWNIVTMLLNPDPQMIPTRGDCRYRGSSALIASMLGPNESVSTSFSMSSVGDLERRGGNIVGT